MSQTHTQVLHRSVVNPTRNHDYLYDPNYTLSSNQDHARDAYKAHTKVDRIKRVPEYKQMFSALPHFPRFQLRLEATDPVPKFIDRQWRGYADQNREALIRYKTCNYDPSIQVPPVKYEDAKVTGENRYKYFRRPIIPFLQQVPPEVLLQPTTVDPLAPPGEVLHRAPTPATRTIEIQTDYRDSEAQTGPYTPEYVVRPGSAPELLTLATLTYNHGLPAGLAEVEMIERARAKRAWERTLPPLSDVSQLEKRKRMMDEMETKEWLLREQEIEKLQEERLEVLKKLLIQREVKQQELNDKRLDKLWSKKQKIKEEKIHKIRKEHIRTIRRLTRKAKNVEGKLERRDHVKEYGKFESQVHAPLTRVGVFLDRGSEQYVVKSQYLNTFQGLLELEASLPDFVTQPRIRAPQKPPMGAFGYVKKKYRLTKELEDMSKAIVEAKKKSKEPPKPLRFLTKVEKPIPRPPTPTIDVPSEEVEKAELAAIFIQKVIRGRAIQNMMYEGKQKRIELINEIRSTHSLQKAEMQMKRADRQNVVTLQRQRRLYQHKESYINEIISNIEGESIGDLLDFLSKELIRLQEERRIHAISMLAERRRRLREAEESGRRQVEERRRREEDEIFKQLMKIHQSTVDTYLEDIVMSSVEGTAEEQARNEIRKLADEVNNIAYEIEERRTHLQSEEIVSELVHSFLLPEILKNNSRDKIKRDQKKHLLAAHRIIFATTEPIVDEMDKEQKLSNRERQEDKESQGPSQSGSSPSSRAVSLSPGRASPSKRQTLPISPTQPKGEPPVLRKTLTEMPTRRQSVTSEPRSPKTVDIAPQTADSPLDASEPRSPKAVDIAPQTADSPSPDVAEMPTSRGSDASEPRSPRAVDTVPLTVESPPPAVPSEEASNEPSAKSDEIPDATGLAPTDLQDSAIEPVSAPDQTEVSVTEASPQIDQSVVPDEIKTDPKDPIPDAAVPQIVGFEQEKPHSSSFKEDDKPAVQSLELDLSAQDLKPSETAPPSPPLGFQETTSDDQEDTLGVQRRTLPALPTDQSASSPEFSTSVPAASLEDDKPAPTSQHAPLDDEEPEPSLQLDSDPAPRPDAESGSPSQPEADETPAHDSVPE